jgi:hypothetical protein
LLTLLAVPVFYSLFDDASELRFFRTVGGAGERFWTWIRRRRTTTSEEIEGSRDAV